jgi:hypothetical protein
MSTDAAGSQYDSPVIWPSPMPTAASAMPNSATVSSKSTIFTFGSRLSRA